MRHFAIAFISFLAPLAAQPCASLSYGWGGWAMWDLRWGSVQALGHHIQFVPYARGIAAVVLVDVNSTAHPRFCLQTLSAQPGCSSLYVIGWAWAKYGLQPNHVDVTLAGTLDGALWKGPLRDIHRDPIGFQLHPGVPMRQSAGFWNTQLGLLIFDVQGSYSGFPDLQAFLLVPESGSW